MSESPTEAGPTPPDGPATDSADAPDEETHTRLIGIMAKPLSASVPVRRSTVLLVVAFLGFGALLEIYPPASTTTVTVTSNNPDVVPGLVPASTTTTTTRPPTPTTSTPSVPSTSGPSTTTRPTTTTTTGPTGSTSTTTTTTRPAATSTSVPKTGATTTVPGGSGSGGTP